MNTVEFLRKEIEVLRSRLQPHDTGHIHTAISVLEDRIKEIETPKQGKTYMIINRSGYKLILDVVEVAKPKGTYSIELTGIQFKDGEETSRSTYDFFLDKLGIYKLIVGLEDYMGDRRIKPTYPDDISLSKAKCHMEMDSPFNDGYTREFYRKELDRLNTMYEST